MKLKIVSSSLAARVTLIVDDNGFRFGEDILFSNRKKYDFEDADCILISQDNRLSIQVGTKIMRVPFKPDKPVHQEIIKTLVSKVRQANGLAAG